MTETPVTIEERLRENIAAVRERIAEAAQRAGRSPGGVSLMAVTKTVPASTVNALVGLGLRDIGENRVQPALSKAPDVVPGALWHMIGHLQRNKVRKALGLFKEVHSVDSKRLAEKIDAEAASLGLAEPVPVYVQVNVSGEGTKFGTAPAVVADLVTAVGVLPRLALRGLMTMAPYGENPEEARPWFAELRAVRDDLVRTGAAPENLGLSMGMSGDFEVAVEEGATVVRIGQALFHGLP